jgi:di/tricarboxylate transporter
LKVAEDQVSKLEGDHGARCLVEVVVSQRFPFLNKTIRDANFRNHYGAAIIAVAREAEIIKQRIGDIVLKAGDTLLLETDHNFVDRQKYRRDFLLVSEVEDSAPVRYEKTNVAFASLGLMLLLVMGLDWSMLKAAVVSGLVMLATGCLSMNDVRQAVKWDVLLVIAASLAMGQAVQVSGLAQVMGELTVSISGSSPWVALLAIFVVTAALSALISNLAAAVVIFPIMVAAAESLGVSIVPFAITLMIAASASFATPIGYQTNLMVYGPGDYRFMDFIRMGLPLTLLVGLLTVVLVPLIWPF